MFSNNNLTETAEDGVDGRFSPPASHASETSERCLGGAEPNHPSGSAPRLHTSCYACIPKCRPTHPSLYNREIETVSCVQSCPHRQSLFCDLLALRALGCEEASRVGRLNLGGWLSFMPTLPCLGSILSFSFTDLHLSTFSRSERGSESKQADFPAAFRYSSPSLSWITTPFRHG